METKMPCKRTMATAQPSPVKVVFIETKYVKTDELQFKSVVQKLTGNSPVIMTRDLPEKVMSRSHEGLDDGGGLELLHDLMAPALMSPVTVPEEVRQYGYYVEPTAEEFYSLWEF